MDIVEEDTEEGATVTALIGADITDMKVLAWFRYVLASQSRARLLVEYTQSDKHVTTAVIGILILAVLVSVCAILTVLGLTTT